VIWAPSSKRRAYVTLCAGALPAGVLAGRPELIACALAFAAICALAYTGTASPTVRVEAPDRPLIEGDSFEIVVEVDPGDDVSRIEVATALPARLRLGSPSPQVLGPWPNRIVLAVTSERWGVYDRPRIRLLASDRWGLSVAAETIVPAGPPVRVVPAPTPLRDVVAPPGTQAAPGDWRSVHRGGGSEFAELRPYTAGEPLRAVNWRASARRGVPFVTERHAELAAEIVLFLDAFDDVGGPRQSTLAVAVRSAVALARVQLAHRDRVGVVGFGGAVWWIEPNVGRAQEQRIVDTLLLSRVIVNVARHDVTHVPRSVLPPRATVLALSPLLDDRILAALLDLAHRGRDVAVLELDPEYSLPSPTSPVGRVTRRLWSLEREERRMRLRRTGIACVQVPPDRPLAPAIDELNEWRRAARRTAIA
jgi:uncharacterized protein (DUF58 family)